MISRYSKKVGRLLATMTLFSFLLATHVEAQERFRPGRKDRKLRRERRRGRRRVQNRARGTARVRIRVRRPVPQARRRPSQAELAARHRRQMERDRQRMVRDQQRMGFFQQIFQSITQMAMMGAFQGCPRGGCPPPPRGSYPSGMGPRAPVGSQPGTQQTYGPLNAQAPGTSVGTTNTGGSPAAPTTSTAATNPTSPPTNFANIPAPIQATTGPGSNTAPATAANPTGGAPGPFGLPGGAASKNSNPAATSSPAAPTQAAALAPTTNTGNAGNPGFLAAVKGHIEQGIRSRGPARIESTQLRYLQGTCNTLQGGSDRVRSFLASNRWSTPADAEAFRKQRGQRIQAELAKEEAILAGLDGITSFPTAESQARHTNRRRQAQRNIASLRNDLARLPLAGPAGRSGEDLVIRAIVADLHVITLREAMGYLSDIHSAAVSAGRPVDPALKYACDCVKAALAQAEEACRQRRAIAAQAGVLEKVDAFHTTTNS